MNLRRPPRAALPAATVALCALLTSACTGAHTSPVGEAVQRKTVSPAPAASPTPAVKTLPPSHLCSVLDLTAARKVRPDLRPAPRVGPDKGTAPDVCTYATTGGTALLSLNPATLTYAAERTAARSLVEDPASADMRDVQVTEVPGLGRPAFEERGYATRQAQYMAYLVWYEGSRAWVLTLAQTDTSKGADHLTALARQITPRLPG